MNTILRKHIITLIILIVIGAVCIAGVLVLLTKMNTKMVRVAEIKERLASYQKNKKAFDDEADQLRLLGQRISALEAFVVTPAVVPAVLSQIETIALSQGVSFEITSVQTPTIEDKTKLFIECTIIGSYEEIQTFFTRIQQQEFVAKIGKVYIFSAEGEQVALTGSGTLSTGKPAPKVSKELQWQAVATIEIISF